MDLQITWQAAVNGDHTVCIRLTGTLPYMCQTINGTAGLNSNAIFNVPDNFCENVKYEGYVVADCEKISNPQPQFALEIVQKTDPCVPYEIICSSVPLANITIFDGGALYQVGDDILANGVPITTVASVDGTGGILGVIPPTQVLFSGPPTLTIQSVSGNGGLLLPVMDECIPIVTSCDGANDDGTPQPGGIRPVIELGESLFLCSETVPAPTPAAQYTVSAISSEGCHCEGCVTMVASNPTGNILKIYYTVIENFTDNIVIWSENIPPGAVNLPIANQALAGSVSYDVGLTVVETPCPA